MFDFYADKDFMDIQSFANFAKTVDEKLKQVFETKYAYVKQPNNSVDMGVRSNVGTNGSTNKFQSLSDLLMTMHNAQKTLLLSLNDPQERQLLESSSTINHLYTALNLHDEVLEKFKTTFQKITGKQIEYKEDDGKITFTVISPSPRSSGGKKRRVPKKNSNKM